MGDEIRFILVHTALPRRGYRLAGIDDGVEVKSGLETSDSTIVQSLPPDTTGDHVSLPDHRNRPLVAASG